MRLLLDTHIWVWLASDPVKLGPQTISELRNSQNELWLSPISTWEVLTLHRKGRIRLNPNPAEWLARAVAGLLEAPFNHEIAAASASITLHPDPGDRFLAATAQVLDMILVTADTRLLGLPNVKTLANR